MMLPTHLLAGLALAVPVAWAFPGHAPAILAGGVAGSVLPDLDMYSGHRRALHFPVYYPLAALAAAGVAALTGSTPAVGLAAVLAAAAVHCRMDQLGGSLELRPWEGGSDRAVYDHYRGEWRAPRRWIRYDGSPRDLVLASALGFPLLYVVEGWLRWVVVAALVVGATYVVLRRQLADLAEWLVAQLPTTVVAYLPGRYREP